MAPKNHKIVAETKAIQHVKAKTNGTGRRTNKNGQTVMNWTVNRIAVQRLAIGASPAPEFATGPVIGPANVAALI